MPVNYDDRVLQEFTKLPWRWDEHKIPNRLALNMLTGFLLDGFTGNITINCEGGTVMRITPAPVIKQEDIKERFFEQIEKSK